MSFVHGLRKGVRNAGADADQCGLLDAELGRDLVSGAGADTPNVASQPIRIFGDKSDRIDTAGLVNPHRARCGYAIAVQEQHDLADDLLIGPASDDPLGALRSNASHFTKAMRLLLDDVEYGLSEGTNELLRIDRPDAADHPGAEVFLDAFDCGRRC